jgi:hypothetical protein
MSKKKSNNNLLLIAGVGVVGWYLWSRSSTPVVAASPGLTPVLTSTQSAPTVGTGSAATPTPSLANDARIPEIQQWIATLDAANAAQATRALQIMSQDEIAGLYDVVHNDFYGNGITTDAQRTFWNAWRVKYHVLDGTYA